MKFSKALILSACCMFMLTACTGVAPTANKRVDKSARDNYVERKSPFFDGIVIASTNNPCIDQFTFIRGNKIDVYKNYSADYAKIGDGYRFLNVNQHIMGKEAKDVYTMQLDLKLDTLCSKAHYTSYQIVKEKMRHLTNI